MNDKTKIDVIVPQFGHGQKTREMVYSIWQNYWHGHPTLDIRVILVDNGSEESALAEGMGILRPGKDLVIRSSKNLGFVRGTNLGICASDAPYVVFQNNDTLVYPGLYESLKAAVDTPLIGAAGPISSETEHSWQSWNRIAERGILDFSTIYKEFRYLPHETRAKMLSEDRVSRGVLYTQSKMLAFFCTMFRAETIRQTGLLSTDFGVGLGDDDDYCARIRLQGYKVALCLDAYVFHDGRSTFKQVYSDAELKAMSAEAIRILKNKYGDNFGA